MKSPGRLQGRVAVVTGGAGGIGSIICRAFAEEGARVAVCDTRLNAAEEIATEINDQGLCAKAWAFDVSRSDQVEVAADVIESTLGELTIWVNNAGISKVIPFLECTENIWDTTLAVNLKGTYIGCQAAIRRMIKRQHGVVINMSSQSGKVGTSHYAAYCASKFGIIGLTQSLAVEFAKDSIRVNAICPGIIPTALWSDMLDDYARKRAISPENVQPYLESRIPLGRLCSAEDVANAAVFLACDDSSYMTGQALDLSGGYVMS